MAHRGFFFSEPLPDRLGMFTIADEAPTLDKAVLAAFSAVDIVSTQAYLHESPMHRESDPLLGPHPSLSRMLVTGGVINYLIDSFPGERARRVIIAVEFANAARQVVITLPIGGR